MNLSFIIEELKTINVLNYGKYSLYLNQLPLSFIKVFLCKYKKFYKLFHYMNQFLIKIIVFNNRDKIIY